MKRLIFAAILATLSAPAIAEDESPCYALGYDVGAAAQRIHSQAWLDVGPFDEAKLAQTVKAYQSIDPENAPGVPEKLLEAVSSWRSAIKDAQAAGCRGDLPFPWNAE